MEPSPPSTTTAASEIAAGAMTSLETLAVQRTLPFKSSAITSALLVPTKIMSAEAATPPERLPLPVGIWKRPITAPDFSSKTRIAPLGCAAKTLPLATAGIKLLVCLPPSALCHCAKTVALPVTAGNGKIFLSLLLNQENELHAESDKATATKLARVVHSFTEGFTWRLPLLQTLHRV